MGASTLVTIIVALIIWFGLRSILRDWRKKFESDDRQAEARKKAQLERNRQEAKSSGVVDLKRGDDGVYRPGGDKDQ